MAKVTVAERVVKDTRCDWLLATTNVESARTLHNKRLTDSILESARRLLSWSGQQHTNVLASLRPAYIRQLLGVSRQIIRLLGVSRLMYARHKHTHAHKHVSLSFFHILYNILCCISLDSNLVNIATNRTFSFHMCDLRSLQKYGS